MSPTNHLDVYMVEFLEQLLLKKIISTFYIHDRYFIDNIAHFSCWSWWWSFIFEKFNGGYSSYLETKEQLFRKSSKDHEKSNTSCKREASIEDKMGNC